MARLRRVKRKRRRVRSNRRRKTRKRRVRRNAWPKGKSRKKSNAARKGWRTRRAKKKARSAAAKRAARKRPKRRRRARKKGWRRQKSDHSIAGKIGWAGRKRRRSSTYVRSRGVKKRKLKSYRRRHKPARRRKTRVSYWGRVAANPRRRRRRRRATRRNPVRRRRRRRKARRNPRRRRRTRRTSYRTYRYNPAASLSLRGLKTSVKDMFRTNMIKSALQIAGGSLAVGVANAYVGSFIEDKVGIRSRIAAYTGEYASKALYVYDKAFTLALTGAMSFGVGAAAKMLKVKESTRRQIQTSIAMGGALLVAGQVVADVVAIVGEKLGIALPMGDYLGDYATLPPVDAAISRQIASELGDYATTYDYGEAGSDLRDFATVGQVDSASRLGNLDFEDDASGVAAMSDYIMPESF